MYGESYGEPQECVGDDEEALLKALKTMDKYMNEEVVKPEYDKVRSECKNQNPRCLFWAHTGECETNPSFMLTKCAPACETCKNIDYDFRYLHNMFERIVDKYENATAVSQPPTEGNLKKMGKLSSFLVEAGQEYGAHAWMHLRDFKTSK